MSAPATEEPVWAALFPERHGYLAVPSRGRAVIVVSRDRRVLRYVAGAVLSVPPGAGPAASLLMTGVLRRFRLLTGSRWAWSLAAWLLAGRPAGGARRRRAGLGGLAR